MSLTDPPVQGLSTDILHWFLDDIAHLPALSSRHEWLPLLRRIRRGKTLAQFADLTGKSTKASQALLLLRHCLHEKVSGYNGYCRANGYPALDISALANGLDEMFIRADFAPRFPIQIELGNGRYDNKSEPLRNQWELGWEIVYLLSLFPAPQRIDCFSATWSVHISEHAAQARQDADTAKEVLTEGTLRYVFKVARHYIGKGLPYLDLVQEGTIGLMRATETYREERGQHFQQHAASRIMQVITRAIADRSRLIRIPAHAHESIAQAARAYDEYIDNQGCPPDDLEFGVRIGYISSDDTMILQEYRRFLTLRRKISSMVEPYRQLRRTNRKLKRHKRYRIEHEIDMVEPLELVIPLPYSLGPRTRRIARYVWANLHKSLGRTPQFFEFCLSAGWLDHSETAFYKAVKSSSFQDALKLARTNLRKASLMRTQLRLAEDYHLQIDTVAIAPTNNPTSEYTQHEVADFDLVDDISVPAEAESVSLRQTLQRLINGLNDREAKVLRLRYGLADGVERTLEEVGREFDVTRERVRQIEAKALKRLRHPLRARLLRAYLYSDTGSIDNVLVRQHNALLKELDFAAEIEQLQVETHVRQEKAAIVRILDQRLPRIQRRRVINTLSKKGRAELFRRILCEQGQPIHYNDLYSRAIAEVPEELAFSKQAAYGTLFYHPLFEGYGNGLFGLAEWKQTTLSSEERIYQHCPQPLLNETNDPRSFLETILVGMTWLQSKPDMPAQHFYLQMLGWANRTQENFVEAQAAFDAWHAVGMLAPIDYASSRHLPVKLSMPGKMTLAELRTHCLETVISRIPKMLELLAVVEQFPRPTVASIQRALFAGEGAEQDVLTRLRFLAAFDAVRREGDIWRLGSPGSMLLTKHPAPDLPDWGEFADEEELDDTPLELEWDDALGLILA